MACICHLELPCVCLCGMSSVVCLPSSGLAPGFCRIATLGSPISPTALTYRLWIPGMAYGSSTQTRTHLSPVRCDP